MGMRRPWRSRNRAGGSLFGWSAYGTRSATPKDPPPITGGTWGSTTTGGAPGRPEAEGIPDDRRLGADLQLERHGAPDPHSPRAARPGANPRSTDRLRVGCVHAVGQQRASVDRHAKPSQQVLAARNGWDNPRRSREASESEPCPRDSRRRAPRATVIQRRTAGALHAVELEAVPRNAASPNAGCEAIPVRPSTWSPDSKRHDGPEGGEAAGGITWGRGRRKRRRGRRGRWRWRGSSRRWLGRREHQAGNGLRGRRGVDDERSYQGQGRFDVCTRLAAHDPRRGVAGGVANHEVAFHPPAPDAQHDLELPRGLVLASGSCASRSGEHLTREGRLLGAVGRRRVANPDRLDFGGLIVGEDRRARSDHEGQCQGHRRHERCV